MKFAGAIRHPSVDSSTVEHQSKSVYNKLVESSIEVRPTVYGYLSELDEQVRLLHHRLVLTE